METLLMIHSVIRWVIVVVAMIAVVKLAVGWLRGSAFKGMDRGLTSGFSGLMDLQATLGIIILIWFGVTGAGFPMFRIAHGLTMIIAAVVAHLPARWKNAADSIRFRNTFFCVLGSLLLVFIGVAILPR